MSEDDFFDEDGNLVKTAWQIEQDKRDAEQAKRDAEARHLEQMRKANAGFTVEEQRIKTENFQDKIKRKREIRDEWMSMPQWIKSMPRVPLDAPPTEGRKEKMLYSISGKVSLTEDERKKREADLSRLRMAMDDYRGIHRRFPPDTPMSPVTVVSLGDRSGGTTLCRLMSKALSESRSDMGSYAVVDFADPSSDLSSWYPQTKTMSQLRHVLSQLRNSKMGDLSLTDVFPPGGDGERYIANPDDSHRRVTPTLYDAMHMYRFMKKTSGVCFFDCTEGNMDALVMCASFSTSMIFTVPLDNNAPAMIDKVIEEIRESGVSDSIMSDLLSRSYVVVSGPTPKTATSKGVKIMKDLGKRCASSSNIPEDNVVVLPYDKGLTVRPLKWNALRFGTKHIVRSLCGDLISDALDRYGDE